MLIKACLNGSRSPADHPAVPVTPEQVAADARGAVDAGAGALHLHPRNREGVETFDPAACGSALRAVREACPGVPVSLTTGVWIDPGPTPRLELVRSWVERPDLVSINFSDPEVIQLCDLARRIGVGIEAGLATVGDVEVLADSGHAHHVVRVLVEPQDPEPAAAEASAAGIGAALDHADIAAPRVYHGSGIATWRVIEVALEDGWDVRVGLEDTLHLPDGSVAPGNAELVRAAVEMARKRGRLRV